MITIKGTKKEIRDAHFVASNVDLIDIYLSKLNMCNKFHNLPEGKWPFLVEFDDPSGSYELINNKILLVKTYLSLWITVDVEELKNYGNIDDEIKNTEAIRMEIEYTAKLSLPKEKIPDDVTKSGFDAFAKLNGLHLCIPFIREEINNISGKSKVKIPTIPLVIIKEEDCEVG